MPPSHFSHPPLRPALETDQPKGPHRPHDVPVGLCNVEAEILQCLCGQGNPERRKLVRTMATEAECSLLGIAITSLQERREVALRTTVSPTVLLKDPGGTDEVFQIPFEIHRACLPFLEPGHEAVTYLGTRELGVRRKAETGEELREFRLNPFDLGPVRVGGQHGHQQRLEDFVVAPRTAREPFLDLRHLAKPLDPLPPSRPRFEPVLNAIPECAPVHLGIPRVVSDSE